MTVLYDEVFTKLRHDGNDEWQESIIDMLCTVFPAHMRLWLDGGAMSESRLMEELNRYKGDHARAITDLVTCQRKLDASAAEALGLAKMNDELQDEIRALNAKIKKMRTAIVSIDDDEDEDDESDGW
jgi:hypothetical protein